MMIGCICSTNGGVEKFKQNLCDEDNAETTKRGKRCIWNRINKLWTKSTTVDI